MKLEINIEINMGKIKWAIFNLDLLMMENVAAVIMTINHNILNAQ